MVRLKAIKPKQFERSGFEHRLRSEFNSVVQGVKHDFEQTVETWDFEDKPHFNVQSFTFSGTEWTASIWTDDDLYRMIERGAKPHDIPLHGRTAMIFGENYDPKTVPGVIGSLEGGESGGPIFAYKVRHPGFEGRQFSRVIARKWQAELKRRMNSAMRIGIGLSGHDASDLFKPNAGRFISPRSSASDFITRFGRFIGGLARRERNEFFRRNR